MKRSFAAFTVLFFLAGCRDNRVTVQAPVSKTGVQAVTADVHVGSDGLTVEQRNIKKRIEKDNKPGAIKHLYVFSPMSGQCMLYSTVKGKVTSGGKRLTPYSVYAGAFEGSNFPTRHYGVPINIGGYTHYTSEVLQDDGTYGTSVPYLYWFDARDQYHQRYITTGEIHVSDHPLPVKNIIVNIEQLSQVAGDDAGKKE